jgi:hypothetical protein
VYYNKFIDGTPKKKRALAVDALKGNTEDLEKECTEKHYQSGRKHTNLS